MKIIATCGHPHSEYATVGGVLNNAGVAEAKRSRTEKLNPQDIQSQIFRMYDMNENEVQVETAPKLGNICQEFANDLFMGNMSQSNWGWSDSKTTWLLNFWKDYDPQIRFVLVYSSPEFAIANMLHQQVNVPSDLGSILQSWNNHNTEIIKFYNRNTENSVLVNIQSVVQSSNELVDLVISKFGIDIQPENLDSLIGNMNDGSFSPAVATQLAKSLLDDIDHDVAESYDQLENQTALLEDIAVTGSAKEIETSVAEHNKNKKQIATQSALSIKELGQKVKALYQELEASADLPYDQAESTIKDKIQAFRDYNRLIHQLEKGKKTNHLLKSEVNKNQKYEKKQAELKREIDDLKEQQKTLSTVDENQHKELEQENELMLLQLHQVQEELEHYFLENQKLINEAPKQVEQEIKYDLSSIKLDLRKENFQGENWYYSEADGRWAGPETTSTIKLPVLENKGEYEIKLDIVDAMEAKILTDIQGSLNGQSLTIHHKKKKSTIARLLKKEKRYPATVKLFFNAEDIPTADEWLLQLKFPKVISPAEQGKDEKDLRKLAIRMRSVTLKQI